MARIRITIEYDTDGQSVGHEIQDWVDGNVTFLDLWELRAEPDVRIAFDEAE